MKNMLLFLLVATFPLCAKDVLQVEISAVHSVTHEARDDRAISDRAVLGSHTPGRQIESFNLDTIINGEHVVLICIDDKGCESPALGIYSAEMKRAGQLRITFRMPLTHKEITRWYKASGAW